MNNEYYGIPTTPTSDYLAHYGIKGMKWGVRKARESGNSRALGRQYAKAQRKLAKLERRAASGKKYAKRAAALGAGAAVAGGLAAAGTLGVARGVGAAGGIANKALNAGGYGMQRLGKGMQSIGLKKSGAVVGKAGLGLRTAGVTVDPKMKSAARAIQEWGGKNSIGKSVSKLTAQGTGIGQSLANQAGAHSIAGGISKYGNKAAKKAGTISNSGYARIAAAGLGAGLAGGAAYNAYRAATTKRAAAKAAAFRKEMNKAFAGTQYANGGGQRKKRRR